MRSSRKMTTEEILEHLRKGTLRKQLEKDHWIHIINFLYDELETFLNIKFHRDPDPDIQEKLPYPSFCCNISSASNTNIPLATTWRGTVGMQAYEDSSCATKIDIRANFFLFHGQQRLVTSGGHSYIECIFRSDTSRFSSWQLFGWLEDEWDEFADVESPTSAPEHGRPQ